jgi:cell division septum initiation protein DivIVA
MEAQALRQENTDLKARVEDLVNRLAEATNPPEEPVRESSHAV